MDALEMKAWTALCDNTEANEIIVFDAVAIIVDAGVSYDTAVAMAERWSTQAGHRIRVAAGGRWRWDFGPQGEGYSRIVPA